MRTRIQPAVVAAILILLAPSLAAAALSRAAAVRALETATGGSLKMTVSPATGQVTFLRFALGRGARVSEPTKAPADNRARSFLSAYSAITGLPDANSVAVRSVSKPDEVGAEHVRLQQTHAGIPVSGAQMTVHLHGSYVTALHAKTVADLDGVDVEPAVDKAAALTAAADRVATKYGVARPQLTVPQLELFNRGLFEGTRGATRLSWFVEAQAPRLLVFVWVDAHTGEVLFDVNQATDGLTRAIYDQNYNAMTPLPGMLTRFEGSPPSGVAAADDVYDFTGDTYNYYLTMHGRDSFDDLGAAMISTVRYCDSDCGCPCFNAFWNGNQTVFGTDPFNTDDVVGHEWTHGVTQYTAGLIYYKAPGAMNESFSDIFGETIDLLNPGGYDTPAVRWHIAEAANLTTGIRNMMSPNTFPGQDPPKMTAPQFYCADTDAGGVHSNSGIGNHAYALMVDGGTYNGYTISGIGLTKAAKIEYRALTVYLTPTSEYADDYDALQQACTDLLGVEGITVADCAEMKKALDAVEMSYAWPCTCGNGVLDAGEDCDDGNKSGGDCCSPGCTIEADGTACSDGSLCTNPDQCQSGTCTGTAAPVAICRAPVEADKASLSLQHGKTDRFAFAFGKGAQTLKAEFGTPTTSTNYSLCVYGDMGGMTTVLVDFTAPGASLCNGKPCWKERKTGFWYGDRSGSRGGLKTLRLREGVDGKTKISANAGTANLSLPALPLNATSITAQVVSSDGQCWGATFLPPFTKNLATGFKDKGN